MAATSCVCDWKSPNIRDRRGAPALCSQIGTLPTLHDSASRRHAGRYGDVIGLAEGVVLQKKNISACSHTPMNGWWTFFPRAEQPTTRRRIVTTYLHLGFGLRSIFRDDRCPYGRAQTRSGVNGSLRMRAGCCISGGRRFAFLPRPQEMTTTRYRALQTYLEGNSCQYIPLRKLEQPFRALPHLQHLSALYGLDSKRLTVL